jgi:Holliday junction resolvasome RuvABC endonuclease subunit
MSGIADWASSAYHNAMNAYRYLIAVDPSLTCTGWALFLVSTGEVAAVGKVKGLGPSIPLATRLERLQRHIGDLLGRLGLDGRDILVCESPTTIRDPHNALKVEQVRGLFESLARAQGVRVPGRVNPRSVQYEVMGLKGKQLCRAEVKSAAVKTAQYLYATNLSQLGLLESGADLRKHQDIVDAVLIGRLALMRVQAALNGGVTLESMFDVQKAQRRGSWRVRSCGLT